MVRRKKMFSPLWDIGNIPFVYKHLKKPTSGDGLPDTLPFSLGIDNKTGTLVQIPSKSVSVALNKAYLKGAALSGIMDEEGIGREYAEDFLCFLQRSLKRRHFNGLEILEIGCGTGYFLYRLKRLGAEVLGLEPGPLGREGSRRFRVPVIRDFFPSSRIDRKFDLIVFYGVLEHIQSPLDFLSKMQECLAKDGRMVVAVPDSEPYIKSGDISMFMHQHWNYYHKKTLRSSFKKAVELNIGIENSAVGGALYAITARRASDRPIISRHEIAREGQGFIRFRKLSEKRIGSLLAYFKEASDRRQTVGIFVPGRAINFLFLMREQIDLSQIRFFDDNKLLHGTYFPGFDVPVEPRRALIDNPPDRVMVMSRSFGKKIYQELKSAIGKRTRIAGWDELFAGATITGAQFTNRH